MLWHTARLTVYLACLPSHVLRAYCTFESKQANSITLFGRPPNKKESLNTSRKWEWRARISEVGFLRESLGWVRIKCLLSALTSVHGRFPFTKNFRKLPLKGPSSEERFHLTQVPFVYAFVTKIQDGSTDIAVNSLELPVIPCENSWMEHAFSPEIFQRENRTIFL